MQEIINKIEESTWSVEKWRSFDGFAIETDKQIIRLGISNDQQCCEDWGYFMSNDDLSDFIGAKLISIEIVTEDLNSKTFDDEYEGMTMFVNINTSNGLLQFVAYNNHNGYYSHEARVESIQLTHSESL